MNRTKHAVQLAVMTASCLLLASCGTTQSSHSKDAAVTSPSPSAAESTPAPTPDPTPSATTPAANVMVPFKHEGVTMLVPAGTPEKKSEGGDPSTTTYTFTLTTGDKCMLYFVTYGPSYRVNLDGGIDGGLKAVDGHVLHRGKLTVDGHAARNVRYWSVDGDWKGTSWFTDIDGGNNHMLGLSCDIYGSTKATVAPAAYTKMIASMRIN